MAPWRRLTRGEIADLIRQGRKLTPASLYEPDHCTDGSEFVMADYGNGHRRFSRLWPEKWRDEK